VQERSGDDGDAGAPCPEPEPEPTDITYSAIVGHSMRTAFDIYENFFKMSVRQLAPDLTIDGVQPAAGQSLQMAAFETRLWVATQGQGIAVFDDPLSGGGEIAFWLTPGGVDGDFWPNSIWLDETRDILYATAMNDLYVWEGASTLTQNTPAHRTLHVNAWDMWGITGDEQGDRLFMTGAHDTQGWQVLVFDEASTLGGTDVPDRRMSGVADSTSIAYDSTRDLLYTSDIFGFKIVPNASEVEGPVPHTVVNCEGYGMAHTPVAMEVFPGTDLLFVLEWDSQAHLFMPASTIEDDTPPIVSQDVGDEPIAMTVWTLD
jgi:hypothetical protein